MRVHFLDKIGYRDLVSKVNNVSSEPIPIDLFMVKIDDSPILCKLLGARTDRNGRGIKDVTDYTLARQGPVLGYLTWSSWRVAVSLGFSPSAASPNASRCLDLGHHVLKGGYVGLAAKDENHVSSFAGGLAHIQLVGVHGWWESDVAGGQNEDSVSLATLTEIQGTGTLKVRSVSRSDLDTKSRSEGVTDGSVVIEGDVTEKPWTSRLGEDGLPEGDLSVGEMSVRKDFLAAIGSGPGMFEGQGSRRDTHPEVERTCFLSFLSEANGIDGRPLDPK